MEILLIVAAIFGGLVLLFFISAVTQKLLYPHGYDATAESVRIELQEILDAKNELALDDFISIGPLKNPDLERIRQRVGQLDKEFPPLSKNEFCNLDGIEVIKKYIQNLSIK